MQLGVTWHKESMLGLSSTSLVSYSTATGQRMRKERTFLGFRLSNLKERPSQAASVTRSGGAYEKGHNSVFQRLVTLHLYFISTRVAGVLLHCCSSCWAQLKWEHNEKKYKAQGKDVSRLSSYSSKVFKFIISVYLLCWCFKNAV